MKRRSFVFSGLAAGAMSSGSLATPPNSPRAWFELRFFHLRNDFERPRLDAFLKDVYLPTVSRLGFGPVGFFNVSVGPSMPMLVGLTSYPSLAAMETCPGSIGLGLRLEQSTGRILQTQRTSLRANRVPADPCLRHPCQASRYRRKSPGRAPRVFELRVYEARNLKASLTKIKMFEEGEIAIFRKTGLLPVFFGQTVVGTGLPSLTYMLAYDSVEAREENWRKFISHPDWIKLRSMPGYSDAEIVSNIHSCFLRPTNYSPIR